jgi:hypothetical protein
MKLSIKGLALASGILWGVAMLGMGLANLIWSGYGQQFLQTMASVYFGYHDSQHCRSHCRNPLRSRGRSHRWCDLCLALQPVRPAQRLSNESAQFRCAPVIPRRYLPRGISAHCARQQAPKTTRRNRLGCSATIPNADNATKTAARRNNGPVT